MFGISKIFGNGDSVPPPERASPEDVEKYNEDFLRNNSDIEVQFNRGASRSDPTIASPYSKQDEDINYKSKYPWLYEPDKGVRWDFNPIQLRNLSQDNLWVGTLIQTITKEVAEMSFTITKGEGQTETAKRLRTHPEEREPVEKELPDSTAERIMDLLLDPNPDANWHDVVEMWMSDLLEVGSMTAIKAFPESNYEDDDFVATADETRPLALQTQAPEVFTKDYKDKTGLLDGFWQFDRRAAPGQGEGASRARGIHEPIFFDTDEVVWDDMAPRSNRRYGTPPTLLVEDFLKSVDLAITQEQEYLSRGSIPSGAWVFEEWDREEVHEWKEENEENIKGKPHKSLMFAGRGGDVRFEAMSMNFSELEFTERMKWYARVIASAFQVPTAVVGIEPERVNYNTFQGERENFESNTLGPYMQEIERVVNDQIIKPHWGPEYRFEFQPGMSESTRDMISQRVRGEFNEGLITRNEARRELGRDAVDEDGFRDEVLDETSAEDAGDALNELVADRMSKSDEPLRNADDAPAFALQPGDIEELHDDIRDDIKALWSELLADEGFEDALERFAAADDVEKSLGEISRRIEELLQDNEVVDRIRDAIREHTTEDARDALESAASQEGVDDTGLTDDVVARVRDRDIAFVDEFVQDVEDEVRDTVADGWEEGKSSTEIRDELQEKQEEFGDWQAERIARQEIQIATGEARSEFADEIDKVEVWRTSGDDRVREPHREMDRAWKRPSEDWGVDYSAVGRGVQKESVPGDSEPGIGCRCYTELRDIDEVADDDHAGVST